MSLKRPEIFLFVLILSIFDEMKPVKKNTASKGERLNWTLLSNAKPVILASNYLEPREVKLDSNRPNRDRIKANVLVP